MALFFDADWFDARLEERGVGREVLAAAASLTAAELALVYKDQRELSAGQVAIFAELLGVTPAEVARHAGVSTPVPRGDPEARLRVLEARVAALEAELGRLKAGG